MEVCEYSEFMCANFDGKLSLTSPMVWAVDVYSSK